jgi:CheY-like chemotaxis protein
MRVLIVDDDLNRTEAIREELRNRIGKQPEIWMAQNAESAIAILEYWRECKWNLIFLDHDLYDSVWPEGGDGRTVARAMKRLGVQVGTVVIQSVNKMGARQMRDILKDQRVILAPYPDVLPLIRGERKEDGDTRNDSKGAGWREEGTRLPASKKGMGSITGSHHRGNGNEKRNA